MTTKNALSSLGLGGDGDEVAAITDVEKAFGVQLNYSEATGWETAGDVFESLKRVLPTEVLVEPDLWQRFAVAISGETGADPERVSPETSLLEAGKVSGWLIALIIIVFLTITAWVTSSI
ncbi:hypothetical protein PQU92_07200 [Asticcacaulis sp. BYS171W]|uniref:Carrier domain-containing protein n=1 Tax=Asticcacaulis aquaticus TaxID=2984212 RepID=A0ABT5HSL0_9CAUL|nr:hypothetical protein [Asticcacaulis aquaticus]MDC7683057.1 hypothetical protein [Asticcacaulis aquaticus]